MPEREQGSEVDTMRHRIFLLSPANLRGKRGELLAKPNADFDLAIRVREGVATLGEALAFISGLYFRGKFSYAQTFAAPPPGIAGAFVIIPARGLVPLDTPITLEYLERVAAVPIDVADPRYRLPLERDCRLLKEISGANCDFVLLGSVATLKYLEPMFGIFGHRLLFPEEFVGRGNLSRGGLLLRCVRAGTELTYAPIGKLTRHGSRPSKLPKRIASQRSKFADAPRRS
jgi:hypothetical protein